MKEHSSSLLRKDLLIALAILTITTLIFWLSNLDIQLQHFFFNQNTKNWDYIETPFWGFLYRYGIFLGYVIALLSLLMISFTYWKPQLIFWRRPAIMMVFVILFGPGILVNLVFKDQWGRPRPREITVFGGSEEYCNVLVPNFSGEGKSFPCGHCAIAFYLAVPFLFLRKKYRLLAFIFLIIGLGYGFLMGVARMMAGAHFFSDVIWSAGVVWLVALASMHLLKVNKPVEIPDYQSKEAKKKARLATIVVGGLMPILTVSLLLATPYISSKHFDFPEESLENTSFLITELNAGKVQVMIGEKYQIDYKVNAFGFPNSKLRYDWYEGDTSRYHLYTTGWFTEIRNKLDIIIPENITHQFLLKEGEIHLELKPQENEQKIEVQIEEGDFYLYVPKNTFFHLENTSKSPIKIQIKGLLQKENNIYTQTIQTFKIRVQLKNGEIHILRKN